MHEVFGQLALIMVQRRGSDFGSLYYGVMVAHRCAIFGVSHLDELLKNAGGARVCRHYNVGQGHVSYSYHLLT